MATKQQLLAAGSTVLIAEPALALAHQGGIGAIVGLALGGVAYLAVGDMEKASGKEETSSLPAQPKEKADNKVLHRLLNGKSGREAHKKSDDQTEKRDKPEPLIQTNEHEEMEALQPKPLLPAPKQANGLPHRSLTFAEMRHLIVPGKDILGFDGEQFVFADSLKQSVNAALIGVPGSGKTGCLTFHTAQAVVRNAIVRGWDLHGDVAADLGDCFNILEDADEIVQDCAWIQAERERRLALRKRAQAGDRQALHRWRETRELFYIVDEFNALMLRLKQRKADRELVADTLLSLIAEGRKFKMRCIIAGQTMPAALFGEGGSSARDIINTKYAFQSRENHAQYFGIESRAIETLLPLISGANSAGYAILDGGPLLHAIIVSIPYTTVEDIRALLDEGYGWQEEDEDEDDLIGALMTHQSEPERQTDALPTTTRRHVAMSAQEARRRQLEARKRPVYARQEERVVTTVPVATMETQDERDDRLVLEAYKNGKRSGGAISVATGIPANRVNYSLHRLADAKQIDWQPRK